MDTQKTTAYWNHLKSHLPWAADHVRQHGLEFHPLFLWGDDAQYDELGHKIVTVAMGHVLDDRRDSISTVWPLFAYRVESRINLFLLVFQLPINLYTQIAAANQEQSTGFETLNAFLKPVTQL